MEKNKKKKTKKKKLFVKLAITNTLILLLSLLVVGVISYRKSSASLEKNLRIMSLETLKQIDRGFSEYLNKMTQELDLLDRNLDIKDLVDSDNDYSETQKKVQYALLSLRETINGIENAYFAGEDECFILDSMITDQNEIKAKDRTWYIEAKANLGKIIYSDVSVDQVTGTMILAISRSIVDRDGNFIGVVGIDIRLDELNDYINSISLLENGYVMLVNSEGQVIIDNEKNKAPIENVSSYEYWSILQEKGEGSCEWTSNDELIFVSETTNEKTGWKILGFVEKSEISNELLDMRISMAMDIIICSIFAVLISLFLSNTITKQINKLNELVREVANGNFKDRINVSSQDELGELSENLNSTLDSIAGLLKNIETTASDVNKSSSEITAMAEETTNSVSEVSHAINGVSNDTTNQAMAVDNATNAVFGLSDRIDEVEKNTKDILELSRVTERLSDDGSNILSILIEKAKVTKQNAEESSINVREMNDSIKNINYISDAIAGITEQTDLLALNASIEAARAGEAGKGFAVVAEEIRKLAEESKKSTDEIKAIIEEVNKKSDKFSMTMEETVNMLIDQDKSIDNTKEIFNKITDSIISLVESIQIISNLTSNMTSDKNDVIKEINEISSISQNVAAVSEEVAASSEEVTATMNELTQYAEKLNAISEKLNIEIGKFEL